METKNNVNARIALMVESLYGPNAVLNNPNSGLDKEPLWWDTKCSESQH